MGSWRSVVTAAALAATVWGLVVLTSQPSPGPADARVPVAGVRIEMIAELHIADGEDAVRVERAGLGFTIDGRAPKVDVLEAMTATLGYAHSRRFRPGAATDASLGLSDANRRSLTVTVTDGRLIRLSRGVKVADGSLQWVARDEDAMLITALESDSLFPKPSELIDRRPFASAKRGSLSALRLQHGASGGITLSGDPLRFAQSGMPANRAAVADFLAALTEISITEAPAASPRQGGLVIEVTTSERNYLRVVGTCPESRSLVETGIGLGCVADDALAAAGDLLSDPSILYKALVDRGQKVTSALLTVGRNKHDLDMGGEGGEAARAWLAPMLAARDPVSVAGGKTLAEIELRLESGDSEFITVGQNEVGNYVRTANAPFGWRLTEAAATSVLEFDPVFLRRRQLSARDPSEIVRAVVGKKVISAMELSRAAKKQIAHLEAVRFVAPSTRREHRLSPPRRTIRIEFSPPPIATGDPNVIVVRLGALTSDGCYAQLARDPAVFVLGPKTCAALATL